MVADDDWRADLGRWLEPFLAGLSHPSRRAMCPLYVAGLIGPGERKSVQPMAERLGLPGYDALHHFVSAGAWDAAPLEAELARTKPETALAEIDDAVADGVRFGCVLADAGYGVSAPFRQGLSERGLAWAVGVPRHLKVHPPDVALIPPPPGPGRRRRRPHTPDRVSAPAEEVLAGAEWRPISWRWGTKGRLAARFAAQRVRVADGPAQQIRGKPAQHLPGEEAWVVGERRASGEVRYYLSNLPADTGLTALASAIKARWVCEQAHQQMKEELGLGHFEGRSWAGLHRHALMAMIAYAFLQHRRLDAAKRGEKRQRPAAPAEPAGGPARHRRPLTAGALAAALPALLQVDRRAG